MYKCNSSKDVQLCIDLHNIATKFSFASSLREEIFNDLQDKFGKHPEVLLLIHARNVCDIKTKHDDLADNFLLDISPDQDEAEADVEISRKVQGVYQFIYPSRKIICLLQLHQSYPSKFPSSQLPCVLSSSTYAIKNSNITLL